MMKTDDLMDIAYAMANAYHRTKYRKDACKVVLSKFPDCSMKILQALWQAIDTYVDMSGIE